MKPLPPVLVTAIGLLGIYAADLLLPAGQMERDTGRLTSAIFFTAAAGLSAWTTRSNIMAVRKTPDTPPMIGPFRFSRNPLYLALILFLWSGFTFTSNWTGLGIVLVVLIYFETQVIPLEETEREARYGEAWREYATRVRRWI